MSDLTDKLTDFFITGFSKNTFYRSLAFGIVFSIAMTLIIGWIEDIFRFARDFPFVNVQSQSYWVGIIFVSFSLLFALLGYLSELNIRDDLWTPLRKQLVGVWNVSSQTWIIKKDKIEFDWAPSVCTISIEPVGGKLNLHFELSKSDVFEDQSFDITATTFSADARSKKLIYFYEAELQLKEPVGQAPTQMTKLDFPFLGVLRIISDKERATVSSMKGHWYDINNGIYNLATRMGSLAGLPELTAAVEKGAVTFGGELEFTLNAEASKSMRK